MVGRACDEEQTAGRHLIVENGSTAARVSTAVTARGRDEDAFAIAYKPTSAITDRSSCSCSTRLSASNWSRTASPSVLAWRASRPRTRARWPRCASYGRRRRRHSGWSRWRQPQSTGLPWLCPDGGHIHEESEPADSRGTGRAHSAIHRDGRRSTWHRALAAEHIWRHRPAVTSSAPRLLKADPVRRWCRSSASRGADDLISAAAMFRSAAVERRTRLDSAACQYNAT